MMKLPHPPGLSPRLIGAMFEECDARTRAGLTGKWRKAFDAGQPAPDETVTAERGARPKRKRARRAAAGACPREPRDYPVTEESIRALRELFDRKVAPRMLAREERAAGNPHARPRDYY